MSLWEKFVRALAAYGDTPKAFSLFHIIFLVLIIACTVAVVLLRNKITKKGYKLIILITWIVIVLLEILKQITFCAVITPESVTFKYNWIVFPFQFCSSPLYLLPLIVFLKDSTIKKRIELFSAIFMLIGGLFGIITPSFSAIIWTNYHTLIYHGTMVIIPILIAIKNKEEFKFLNFIQSSSIFFILVAIALLLNWIIPACDKQAINDGFNMFFITWHFAPSVPVLKDLWSAVPYPVFLLLYIIGFLLLCFVIYVIYSFAINHKIDLCIKKESKKKLAKSKKTKSTKKSSK